MPAGHPAGQQLRAARQGHAAPPRARAAATPCTRSSIEVPTQAHRAPARAAGGVPPRPRQARSGPLLDLLRRPDEEALRQSDGLLAAHRPDLARDGRGAHQLPLGAGRARRASRKRSRESRRGSAPSIAETASSTRLLAAVGEYRAALARWASRSERGPQIAPLLDEAMGERLAAVLPAAPVGRAPARAPALGDTLPPTGPTIASSSSRGGPSAPGITGAPKAASTLLDRLASRRAAARARVLDVGTGTGILAGRRGGAGRAARLRHRRGSGRGGGGTA